MDTIENLKTLKLDINEQLSIFCHSFTLLDDIISNCDWIPSDYVSDRHSLFQDIRVHALSLANSDYSKLSHLQILKYRNILMSELLFLRAETDFLNQTIEDISLAQMWHDNASNDGQRLKTFNFFLAKNQFSEGEALKEAKKFISIF